MVEDKLIALIEKLGSIRAKLFLVSFLGIGAMYSSDIAPQPRPTLYAMGKILFFVGLVVAFVVQIFIVIKQKKLDSLESIQSESRKGTLPEYSVPVRFYSNSGVNLLWKAVKIYAWILFYVVITSLRSSLDWNHFFIAISIGLIIWVWSTFNNIGLINFTNDGVHFLSAGYANWRIGRAFHVSYSNLKVRQEPITAGLATNFFSKGKRVYIMYSRFWSRAWNDIHHEIQERLDSPNNLILGFDDTQEANGSAA